MFADDIKLFLEDFYHQATRSQVTFNISQHRINYGANNLIDRIAKIGNKMLGEIVWTWFIY